MDKYQEILSHLELEQLCHPLKQSGAQRRFLTMRGIPYWTSPGGRPVVQRSHLNSMFSGNIAIQSHDTSKKSHEPNRDALIAKINSAKAKRQASKGPSARLA